MLIRAVALEPSIEAAARLMARGALYPCLMEVLQNARRADAKHVQVETGNGQITVTDDGHGITHPHWLLEFGRSEWRGRTRLEKAEGIGFFTLAGCADKYPVHVESRARVAGQPEDVAWQMTLSRCGFDGSAIVQARPDNDPGLEKTGTRVTWHTDESIGAGTVAALVRYFPLPVEVNGEAADQVAYTREYEPTTEVGWRHSRIAIYTPERNVPGNSACCNGAVAPLALKTDPSLASVRVELDAGDGIVIGPPDYNTVRSDGSTRTLTEHADALRRKYSDRPVR